MVEAAGQPIRNARYDVRDEAHQLLVRIQDQRDDIGLACTQPYPSPVGTIADLLGDEPYPPLGVRTDVRCILQRAGYRRDAETGHERDGLQRRTTLGDLIGPFRLLGKFLLHRRRFAAFSSSAVTLLHPLGDKHKFCNVAEVFPDRISPKPFFGSSTPGVPCEG